MSQETDAALEKQWPDDVIEFSSQYGSEGSLSYCVKNLSQGAQTYPNYGDFTEAAVWVRLYCMCVYISLHAISRLGGHRATSLYRKIVCY